MTDNKDLKLGLTIVFAIFLAVVVLSDVITCQVTKSKYRTEAIEQNCAAYNSTTGDWGWLPVTGETR